MFHYLCGTVAHTEPTLAVIDCGGVGYACRTTLNTLRRLEAGKQAKLYTYLHVREDIFELYGFYDLEELNCFKMLINISGVGPKAALSILSGATPERFALSVLTGDEKILTSAPGIGKKLAARIILELKDKLSDKNLTASAGFGVAAVPAVGMGKVGEAMSALMVLGYTQSEAAQAVGSLDGETLSVEEMIRQALKRLVR